MISNEQGLLPKSEQRLQAQAEAYADRGVEEFSNLQRSLLKYSNELAKITDLNNLPSDLPAELVEIIEKNKEAYIHFLRREKREEIEFREQNIIKYNTTFKPVIHELKTKMSQFDYNQIPGYLNSGSNGSAFKIEVNGKFYAAKFSKSITQENFEIKPLLRAKGIEHVAQLIAYSFEDGVVIMDLLPGTDVTKFLPDQAPEYSDKHIVQLIETAIDLYNRGLIIDPKPSNFLYDQKEGFSVLDFHLRGNNSYSLGDMIIDLRTALSVRDWPRIDWSADNSDLEYSKQKTEKDKIYLPMMIRFLSILKNRFPQILNEWKQEFDKREADPRVSQRPLIDRSSIDVQHPDLVSYLSELEKMGF